MTQRVRGKRNTRLYEDWSAQTLHDTMNDENDNEEKKKSRRKLSRAIINCARRSLVFLVNQKTIIKIICENGNWPAEVNKKKKKTNRTESKRVFLLFVFGSSHRQRPCPHSIVKKKILFFCSFLSFAVFCIHSFVPEFILRFRDTNLLNDSIYVTR